MEILDSADIETKFCILCGLKLEDNCFSTIDYVDGVSYKSVLNSTLGKLQISLDKYFENMELCGLCKGELIICYRFIQKVEEVYINLNKTAGLNYVRNPPKRPLSLLEENISPETCLGLKLQQNDPCTAQLTQESDDNSSSLNINNLADETQLDANSLTFNSKLIPVRCCGCKEPLTTNEAVRNHSEKFHRRMRITDKEIITNSPFECLVCYQRFQNKNDFRHHNRKMFAEVLHYCKSCTADFTNVYNLRMHEKTVHKRQKINDQIDELRQSMYKCCICRKQFSSFSLLKQHVTEEHSRITDIIDSENKFECEICCRRYKTQKILTEHQRRPFRKSRFQCSHCGKTFKEKQTFTDHEQSHVNIRPYKCPICGMGFSLKPNYLTHVRYHSVPRDRYKCTFCDKGFRKKHILQEHQLIHKKSELRPYKCHICSFAYTRKDLLECHMKEHMGGKPFKCSECTACYIYERDLRRHNRTKHGGVKFVCEVCSRSLSRIDAYKRHVKTHQLGN